jgi:glycosyltransferase involved in cell wall biosynthesis
MFVHFEECRRPSLKERLALSTRLTSLLATKVICVSDSVAEEAGRFGAARVKIAVRNNPRPARSGDRGPDRAAARAGFGFSDADYVIVAVGHTVPVKGWDVLLKAFGEVARAVPSARLLLAGSHSAPVEATCYQQLLALCAEQQVRERVTFTGHVPDVLPVLRAADVFVLPSRSEGNSYSLLEALDAGLPCVATKVGAAPQMIQDGVNGYLVARLDTAGLAKALIHLGDPARRSKFAKAVALPTAVPTFEEYARQLRRDYERWLGRPASNARPVAPSAA